jgi:hypothetical protein
MIEATSRLAPMFAALGLAILYLLSIACVPARADPPPIGTAPTFTTRPLTPLPNAAAVTRRIWVPGLDDGYVPQGLTFSGGALYISSYLSTDPAQGRGLCRLYRVDPGTGAVTGELDLPPACGHAGGLARTGRDHLVVADTRSLFEVEIATPPAPTIGRVVRTVVLAGNVKGSFAAGSPDAIWLGSYERDGPGRLYLLPLAALARGQLTETDATVALTIPSEAQGAAVDVAGRLWITRSGSRFGQLVRLDPKTGATMAAYEMPIGIEDLSFAPDGQAWALSEAGSRRWSHWSAHYPLILRLDLTRLR